MAHDRQLHGVRGGGVRARQHAGARRRLRSGHDHTRDREARDAGSGRWPRSVRRGDRRRRRRRERCRRHQPRVPGRRRVLARLPRRLVRRRTGARTRCCSICRTRSRRWSRCGGCVGREGSSRPTTATTRPRRGSRRWASWTSGWRSTSSSPAATTLNRTPAATSGRGRSLPGSTTFSRPRRRGASPPTPTGPGGRRCGPIAWCHRHSLSRHGSEDSATDADLQRLAEGWRR